VGILMGLAAGALFGLNAIFIKIGMRRRPIDNGHFMSVLVNVLFLGVLMLFVSLPRWSWVGFASFILAGLMTTWLGRGTSFMAIRLIGPARQGAILISAPLFAAIGGWFFLGEGITLVQAVGGLIISIGLLVLLRSRLDDEKPAAPVESEVADAIFAARAETPTTTRTARIGTVLRHDDFMRGFFTAIMAAAFFGSGFVARKWGLSYLPSALAGAFFGACTALSMIVVASSVRGRFGRLVEDNLWQIPWWFVAAGIATSIALFLQFSAFDYLPAWVVSLLQGTQAVWTLLWAWLFLREEEQIGRELFVSTGLVVTGVAIMTYGL
jgi:drug/metabolite transporter (DMT)-like permease